MHSGLTGMKTGCPAIAVIDTGFDSSGALFSNRIKDAVHIHKTEAGTLRYDHDVSDEHGHGTAVSEIIHSVNACAVYFIVKLSSFDEVVTEDLLIEAIEWCVRREEISIINISMGINSMYYSSRLLSVCRRAVRKNKLIVAAVHHNPYEECYPAYFSFVIAVCSGFTDAGQFRWIRAGIGVNVIASGTLQRVTWTNGKYRWLSGNSLACAHFTGALSGIIERFGQDYSKVNLDSVLTDASSGHIVGFKFFNTETPKSLSINELQHHLDPPQDVGQQRIVLYSGDSPDSRFIIEWLSMRNAIDLSESAGQTDTEWKDVYLFVIAEKLSNWTDNHLYCLHKYLKSAIQANVNLLLLNTQLVGLAKEYIDQFHTGYTGKIYTNVFQNNCGRSLPEVTCAPCKKIAIVGLNLSDCLLLRTWHTIKSILDKVGIGNFTIAANHYQYFFGADALVYDSNIFHGRKLQVNSRYLNSIRDIAGEAGGKEICLAMFNERIDFKRYRNQQCVLHGLGRKIDAFGSHEVILIIPNDIEKDDL